MHGFVEMMWKNSRLSWNPADYGNITKVGLPANQIWLPDITLYNKYVFVYKVAETSPTLVTNSRPLDRLEIIVLPHVVGD